MKLLQLFESQFPTSKEEVEEVLELYKIENYTINDDLTVDVDGDVDLYNGHLRSMPVKFGKGLAINVALNPCFSAIDLAINLKKT